MFSRHLSARRASSLAMAVLLSGLPTLAAAAEPAAPAPPTRSTTPIADAARAVASNQGYWHDDDNDALKWTGFGLIAGGGTLIALGAVLDDEDCFDNGVTYYDCDDVRKVAYVTGGVMAGVGVGLMIMSNHTGRHGRYPSITMRRGRMLVQQRVGF
jgi:hypothetical protein